jgi:tRNA-2-methylthio-N6-dimethylallyladenosine synthase
MHSSKKFQKKLQKSNSPGINSPSKTYYIKTYGCQMNVSDSERIAGFLEMRKFKPSKNINEADLVIFNTCGVRQSAEDRVYGQIHNLKAESRKLKAKIIVTGCLAGRRDVQRRLKGKVNLFTEIKDFPNKFSDYLAKNTSDINCDSNPYQTLNYLNIVPKYTTNFSAYVPIMTGCNNFCSYCVVPYARGREISRPAVEIVKEIKNLVKSGYKEIVLLGQNVNSYSYKKIGFADLLNKLAKNHPELFFKFLTSHPKDFSEDLIKVIAKNKNITREIHLPVQAGSDKILMAMNRPYTQKHYFDLIKKIKKIITEAAFTTDIIVGFPGETRKDFAESVKIFKKVSYNEAYINKYSPRPGTAAWKMKETVELAEKKRREKILRSLIGYGKN